jgi:hypothetical protein
MREGAGFQIFTLAAEFGTTEVFSFREPAAQPFVFSSLLLPMPPRHGKPSPLALIDSMRQKLMISLVNVKRRLSASFVSDLTCLKYPFGSIVGCIHVLRMGEKGMTKT